MTKWQRTRRQALERALEAADGNLSQLARMLGTNRSTIHYWTVVGEIGAKYAWRVEQRLGIPVGESRAEE